MEVAFLMRGLVLGHGFAADDIVIEGCGGVAYVHQWDNVGLCYKIA